VILPGSVRRLHHEAMAFAERSSIAPPLSTQQRARRAESDMRELRARTADACAGSGGNGWRTAADPDDAGQVVDDNGLGRGFFDRPAPGSVVPVRAPPKNVDRGLDAAVTTRAIKTAVPGRRSVRFASDHPGDAAGEPNQSPRAQSASAAHNLPSAYSAPAPETARVSGPLWQGSLTHGYDPPTRGTLSSRAVARRRPGPGRAGGGGMSSNHTDADRSSSNPGTDGATPRLAVSSTRYEDERMRRRRAAIELIDRLTAPPNGPAQHAHSTVSGRTLRATMDSGMHARDDDEAHGDFDAGRGTARGAHHRDHHRASRSAPGGRASGEAPLPHHRQQGGADDADDQLHEWARQALRSAPSSVDAERRAVLQRRIDELARREHE
jgi:hypothetical protein